jgi:RND family efflux transporter MFP subunit
MNAVRLRKTLILIALALLIAAAMWMFLRAGHPGADEITQTEPKTVSIMRVKDRPALLTRSIPAQARASREVHLAFRVDGPLREMPVVVGQFLKMGDTVARMDQRDFLLRVARLEAELETLQARMVEVRRQYERYRALLERDAAPESRFDQARAAFDSLGARIDATTQELQAARNALDDTQLRAPFDGYVHEKFVENYDYVTAGQKVITFLDCAEIEAAAGLPEELLAGDVHLESFMCTFDAYPGIAFPARLKDLARKPLDSNQTYLLTVAFENAADHFVVPGMAATLQIAYYRGPSRSAIAVPVQSVLSDEFGNTFVWLFDGNSATVSRCNVQTGGLCANGMRITSGLEPGDTIIVHGARFLHAGQAVRPVEAE